MPLEVRNDLRKLLWSRADRVGWMHISHIDKALLYEGWGREERVGGLLERYLDRRQVRVYLKDTLMKDYTRTRLADETRPFRVLGLTGTKVTERLTKPNGCVLDDGRIVCWGRATEWKTIVTSTFERSCANNRGAAGVVLMYATGRYMEPGIRAIVEEAARRLGVPRVIWLEV